MSSLGLVSGILRSVSLGDASSIAQLLQCDETNRPASRWVVSRTRRCVEIALALAVLVVAAAPMLILAAAIRLTTKGRVVFSQQRVGAHGRLFRIYKFRTMTEGGKEDETGLTRADDDRVTALGRYLRRFKLDELPQFWNVLRGDMSLIGPRPKLPQYADLVNMPYRPGITGAASVAFCREDDMLRGIDPAELDDFYAAISGR